MGAFGMVRQVQTLTGNAPLRRKVSHSIESQRFIHTPTGSNMVDDSICKIASANSILGIIGMSISRTDSQETDNSIDFTSCTFFRLFGKVERKIIILQCNTLSRSSLSDDAQIRMIYQINTLFQFNNTVNIENDSTRTFHLLDTIPQTTFYRCFSTTVIFQIGNLIECTATSARSKATTTFRTGESQRSDTLVITDAGIGLSVLENRHALIQDTHCTCTG